MKFVDDNTKLKFTGYTRKTDSGAIVGTTQMYADNIMYALQSNIEVKKTVQKINLLLICMFMIVLRYAVKINIIRNRIH